MTRLVRYADIGIANEEDCQRALGISVETDDWEKDSKAGKSISTNTENCVKKCY